MEKICECGKLAKVRGCCRSCYHRLWRHENKGYLDAYTAEYRAHNAAVLKSKRAAKYRKNKERISRTHKEYYRRNLAKISAREKTKRGNLENKKKARAYNVAYRKARKEELAEKRREYYRRNKAILLEKSRAYRKSERGRRVLLKRKRGAKNRDYMKRYREIHKELLALQQKERDAKRSPEKKAKYQANARRHRLEKQFAILTGILEGKKASKS